MASLLNSLFCTTKRINMKKRIFLLTAIILLGCSVAGVKGEPNGKSSAEEKILRVIPTPGLYELAKKWTDEFKEANPAVKIDVTREESAGEENTGRTGLVITDDESLVLRNQAGWNMVVGRDIIVPIMNRKNPAREKISKEGITPQSLERMTANGQRCYVASNADVLKRVKKFMNSDDLKVKGIETTGEEEVISTVSKESNTIGFIKLNSITAPDGQSLPENIELVPIDRNGNGKIDYMEEIYENLPTFKRGVWIGKYPKALSARIYAVSAEKPAGGAETAFLNWVLTDGQQFLNSFGHNDLVLNERQAQLARLEPAPVNTPDKSRPLVPIGWTVIILLAAGAAAMSWRLMTALSGKRKETSLNMQMEQQSVFDEHSAAVPGGLFFDRTHTWAFMKKDGTIKVGIDDFLQHVTGKITRAELRKTGDKIRKGEHLVTLVQNGKQLDIYSPVSGTIRERNHSLSENPSLINTSPYTEGWIYCIEPKNWPVEIQFLSMAEKYKSELKKEFLRLKDFLVSALKSSEPEYALALQDGGALKDNILEVLGPEIWDDFQTKFIDISVR